MAIQISGTTVIDNSRNITNVGNVGDSNTVYFGNGSGLSGIPTGQATFTASGAITSGKGVIINSNGTEALTSSIFYPNYWFRKYFSPGTILVLCIML